MGYDRVKYAPHKDIHTLIPRTSACVILSSKKDFVCVS